MANKDYLYNGHGDVDVVQIVDTRMANKEGRLCQRQRRFVFV